jgi:urea transporter
MMRLACLLALIALAVLILTAVHLDGATATLFSFLGMPALTAAVGLYVFKRWQLGAFRRASRPSTD